METVTIKRSILERYSKRVFCMEYQNAVKFMLSKIQHTEDDIILPQREIDIWFDVLSKRHSFFGIKPLTTFDLLNEREAESVKRYFKPKPLKGKWYQLFFLRLKYTLMIRKILRMNVDGTYLEYGEIMRVNSKKYGNQIVLKRKNDIVALSNRELTWSQDQYCNLIGNKLRQHNGYPYQHVRPYHIPEFVQLQIRERLLEEQHTD
jgi:hypothetical protein